MNVHAADNGAEILEGDDVRAIFFVPLERFVNHLLQLGASQITSHHQLQGLIKQE